MRISQSHEDSLDHCIDWRLRRSLPNHDVKTTDEMKWAELTNGKLLAAAAAADFDLLLTVDQNIKSQQKLSELPINIFVLVSLTNRLADLLPLLPIFEEAATKAAPKQLIEIRLTGATVIA